MAVETMDEDDTIFLSVFEGLLKAREGGYSLDLGWPPRRNVHLCQAVLFDLAKRRHVLGSP